MSKGYVISYHLISLNQIIPNKMKAFIIALIIASAWAYEEVTCFEIESGADTEIFRGGRKNFLEGVNRKVERAQRAKFFCCPPPKQIWPPPPPRYPLNPLTFSYSLNFCL